MNTCDVDTTITVKVKTSMGGIIEEKINVTLYDIPYSTRREECHGYHYIDEIDDYAVERATEEFIENLTVEMLNSEYSDYFDYLDEDEYITEILEVKEG